MNPPKTISIMPDKVSNEIISIYDEFLADWSVPATEVMVPTRYGVTHVTETGPKDGPVIVLLHGMGFPAPFMWATLAPHLNALIVSSLLTPSETSAKAFSMGAQRLRGRGSTTATGSAMCSRE